MPDAQRLLCPPTSSLSQHHPVTTVPWETCEEGTSQRERDGEPGWGRGRGGWWPETGRGRGRPEHIGFHPEPWGQVGEMHQAMCVSREPLAAGGGQGGGGLKMPKTGTLERQGVADGARGGGGQAVRKMSDCSGMAGQ